MRVVWDDSKSAANLRKHGVSFEEAGELLAHADECLEIFDDAHSGEEDRFIAIGPVARGLILVVYTERDEETVRLISARWATKGETEMYRTHRHGGTP